MRADFYFDKHRDDPRQPRDMKLRRLLLFLRASHEAVAHVLEQRFGPGREIAIDGMACAEYGEHFYLRPSPAKDGTAFLTWEHVRLDPSAPLEVEPMLEELLATLVDCLVCELSEPAIVAAIRPLAAALGPESLSLLPAAPTLALQ
jgi:hypothetical protein